MINFLYLLCCFSQLMIQKSAAHKLAVLNKELQNSNKILDDSLEINLKDNIREDVFEKSNDLFENLVVNQKEIKRYASNENSSIRKGRLTKKLKPLIHNGYNLDMNIDNFKSMRYCYFNEVCKNKFRPYFECVCPRSTLCTAQGAFFEGRCFNQLMPYVWIQSPDENNLKYKKT
ncbi:unnamed protein product [Brachionus calyciflorus]|uniref:Uncharacterized protein n=1 Tax=Brachionus calyciflorus TaxID=104777 RepID=A0A814HS72_9BILA|nr:unnamed protein product [Brachionus calyciflorus]